MHFAGRIASRHAAQPGMPGNGDMEVRVSKGAAG